MVVRLSGVRAIEHGREHVHVGIENVTPAHLSDNEFFR